MINKVDIVIPYVDNTDKVWQEMYHDYCKDNHLNFMLYLLYTNRYEDIGLINYQLKLINKNMPFVNNIFLLLSNKEQKPKDLPDNVKVVYHAQFIPKKYLPTFNSTTIEMFLWNIKDLGEYFIYANDDMLPMKPLSIDDFFTENGKIKINWLNEDLKEMINMFRLQCYNSYVHTAIRLHKRYEKNKYIRPIHSMTPMVKSHCKNTYEMLDDIINDHIRAFRTEYQHNQYIYPIFEYFVFGTENNNIDFLYAELNEGIDFNHQIVCINDVPKGKEIEVIKRLQEICK